jgi:hypothetical protein
MFSVSTAATRSKHAAWLSIAAFGWPEPRLRHELQNGWPYRTFPPRSIDWHDPNVSIDPTRGMVTIVTGAGEVSKGDGALAFIWRGRDRQTLALELLAPPDALADRRAHQRPPSGGGASGHPATTSRRQHSRSPRPTSPTISRPSLNGGRRSTRSSLNR